jgi:uncharacterized protein
MISSVKIERQQEELGALAQPVNNMDESSKYKHVVETADNHFTAKYGPDLTAKYDYDLQPEPEPLLNTADMYDVGPDSFGGTDYPFISLEDAEAVKNLYDANPKLKSNPIDDYKYDPADAWIQTYSGKRFTPTNPDPKAIVIEDIAHSLSMQCRFSGHVKRFYSVAQHSVLVSYICNQEDALWGLLHDASEAYLVDVPSPLKRSGQFGAYIVFETQMQLAVCKRFNLPILEPASVKKADTLLLATEARDLMSPLRVDWVPPCAPLPFVIEPLGPQEAKNLFMKRYYELTGVPEAYTHYLASQPSY